MSLTFIFHYGKLKLRQGTVLCLVGQTYTYDADGIRTGKTSTTKVYKYRSSTGGGEIMSASVDPDATLTRYLYSSTTVSHSYITQNGKVVRETIGSGTTAKILDFIYDESGKPFVLIYTNGTADPVTYYYVLNLQGDVVGLLDSSGACVARYNYNAWGEILSVTNANGVAITSSTQIATLNPLRYRGYYYDTETGFYYLQSRYYDPVTHRFINADSLASTGQGFTGTNMFAYCLNDPVNMQDPGGKVSEEAADKIIEEYKEEIIAAGEEFGVDPVIIAVCIYAEQVNNCDFLDTLFDYPLYFIDTSIGIGQVKVSTAIMLEDEGYIEKTADIFFVSRKREVADRLTDDTQNIRYVAAYIKYWQDTWGETLDISSRADILATLYNLGENANSPSTSPKANAFGTYAGGKYDHLRGILYEKE